MCPTCPTRLRVSNPAIWDARWFYVLGNVRSEQRTLPSRDAEPSECDAGARGRLGTSESSGQLRALHDLHDRSRYLGVVRIVQGFHSPTGSTALNLILVAVVAVLMVTLFKSVFATRLKKGDPASQMRKVVVVIIFVAALPALFPNGYRGTKAPPWLVVAGGTIWVCFAILTWITRWRQGFYRNYDVYGGGDESDIQSPS